MSLENPSSDELKAALRVMRTAEAYQVLCNWLAARRAGHLERLAVPDEPGDFRFLQGRANEATDLLKILKEV